ncbi:uncharacterized protein LOC126272015 isoform X1 [Schistocerca gregaria]|uniref:uncharacterized protein LOC126272015 isoform X1 n=1 Tax=Schistocerca gregaria TaxID=7010 RepID=UPI00211EA807|nr:uncharacterized protein LOC126272015 isoform X1 [Schistocerca gregaria]XP_049830464.1 uncharacterized protein LOC126272015 isoform X1 [Schistocerca gregaria]
MSSSPNFQSRLESPQNDFFNYFRCCMRWLPCLQSRRQVHPSASNLVENKFIILSTQKLIRVIHMDYESKIPTIRDSLTGNVNQPTATNSRNCSKILSPDIECSDYKRRSHSMISNTSEQSSEDYWFTHWSRPPKPTDSCNCSFRTSWRSSLRDSRFSDIQNALSEVKECLYSPQEETNTQVIQPTTVHSFANNLVEKILVEVIDHLASDESKNGIAAKTNRAFNVHSTLHKDELNFSTKDLKFFSNGCVQNGRGVLNPSFADHPTDPVVAACNDITGLEDINFKVNRSERLQPNLISLNKSAKNIFETRDCSSESVELKITDAEKSLSNKVKAVEQTGSPTGNKVQPLVEEPPVITRTAHSKCYQKCTHSKNNKRLKPPLYFLHGAGSSADIWLRVMKHFAKMGFEVVAPDMLGHGYSSAPDNPALYSFSNMLKDAVEIFDKFISEQQKCVIIGHAYGCSLAVAISRCRPQQVIQLVLISGGGPTPLAPHTVDCRPVSNSACLMMCMQPLLKCGFRRNVLYSTYGKHMVSCDVAGSGVPQYVLDYLAQGQDWPEGDAAFHRRITIPTLLVHGMQDPLVPLVHECEMERTIPRSFLEVIPNAGHFAMLETPEKLIHMIRCFIDWWNT